MNIYDPGDIQVTTLDAGGRFRVRVEVNGFKLSPPRAQPYIYLSEETFDSQDDALDHGRDYVNQHFPEDGPPFRISG